MSFAAEVIRTPKETYFSSIFGFSSWYLVIDISTVSRQISGLVWSDFGLSSGTRVRAVGTTPCGGGLCVDLPDVRTVALGNLDFANDVFPSCGLSSDLGIIVEICEDAELLAAGASSFPCASGDGIEDAGEFPPASLFGLQSAPHLVTATVALDIT